MKNKYIYFLGIFLAVFILACDSDNKKEIPDPPKPPVPLDVPVDLKVELLEAQKVVVVWKGDKNAQYYEVQLGDSTIQLSGTSCGVSGLSPETSYNWKVRALNENDTTEWVQGDAFTTRAYIDPRDEWMGKWISKDWDLRVTVSGIKIDLTEFLSILPGSDTINNLLENIPLTISKTSDPFDNRITINFPLLEYLEIPAIATLPLELNRFWLEEHFSDTLTIPGTPIALDSIPFLKNIDVFKNFQDVIIESFRIELNEVQVIFGELEYNQIPFVGILGARLLIKTDNDLLNVGINLVNLNLKLTLTSDFIPSP